MVSISFSYREDFPELIRQGIKDQTIRPFNEKRFEQIKRVKKLQLYWKQRTKECFKIADAELTEIFKIKLHRDTIGYIFIWDGDEKEKKWRKATNEEFEEIIRRDGFDNLSDFYDAFHTMYGKRVYDMEFMVIRFRVASFICSKCKRNILECSECGKKFKIGDNIVCFDMLFDVFHFCSKECLHKGINMWAVWNGKVIDNEGCEDGQ